MNENLPTDLSETVARALAEDLGAGDLTAGLIPEGLLASASVVTREPALLCGGPWFEEVFRQLDERIGIEWRAAEGEPVEPGQTLCLLSGPARPLLSGERTALNFLQTLSGTATTVHHHAQALIGTGTRLLDTRKTLPGLRQAQKYAVRVGGGHNHRMGLYDGILIKENHILACGSIAAAVAAARRHHPGIGVEVEVESLDELEQALAAGADILLLDNFDLETLREAVRRTAGRAKLEASGGVDLEGLRAIAGTGVDYISVGALTKHLRAIDLSMRFVLE